MNKDSTPTSPIILYDGDCGVCSRFVLFVLENETLPVIHLASLSSPTGDNLKRSSGIGADIDSIILVVDGQALIYSDAILKTCTFLRQPWRSLTFLRVFPKGLRDWFYRLFAANRSKVPSPHCRLVRPEERNRFLDLDS